MCLVIPRQKKILSSLMSIRGISNASDVISHCGSQQQVGCEQVSTGCPEAATHTRGSALSSVPRTRFSGGNRATLLLQRNWCLPSDRQCRFDILGDKLFLRHIACTFLSTWTRCFWKYESRKRYFLVAHATCTRLVEELIVKAFEII